ncbi:MAG TPA: hypothetical protein VE173_09930, partial [Longimicrobiales bacterium]|nr:hypothetical protein [Longimicrobiales bacterium]
FLTGLIEFRSEFFVQSSKGSRRLQREPRRKGLPRSVLPRRIGVLVACDHQDHVVTAVQHHARPDVEELERVLEGRLRKGCILLDAWGRFGPTARFARLKGIERQDVRDSGSTGLYLRRAWAYGRRLKKWLVRFRGVATKHLPNYLAWHIWIDSLDGRCCRT